MDEHGYPHHSGACRRAHTHTTFTHTICVPTLTHTHTYTHTHIHTRTHTHAHTRSPRSRSRSRSHSRSRSPTGREAAELAMAAASVAMARAGSPQQQPAPVARTPDGRGGTAPRRQSSALHQIYASRSATGSPVTTHTNASLASPSSRSPVASSGASSGAGAGNEPLARRPSGDVLVPPSSLPLMVGGSPSPTSMRRRSVVCVLVCVTVCEFVCLSICACVCLCGWVRACMCKCRIPVAGCQL